MDIFKSIDQFANKHTLFAQKQTIILGLSGGPDSVFLLHYLHAKKKTLHLEIIAAHLDHGWRKNSKEDVEFCEELCKKMHIPFVTSHINELDIQIRPSGSKEQDARKARRFFFERLAKQHNATAIALAQHKNDQEETFFIRLLRGTSLTGLCGMWPKKGLYIRPLLNTSKADILNWLNKHKITYLTDPTNLSDDFLRNRIRNRLIPVITEIDPRFPTTLSNTMERLQQTELFLQKLTNEAFDDMTHFDKKKQAFIVNKWLFLALDPILQYRMLVKVLTHENLQFPVSQPFFDEIIRFLKQPENKKHAIHREWHVVKDKDFFYVASHGLTNLS